MIAPASKPQELFLTIRDGTGKRSKYANEEGEEVDIVFYGGSAGGGKTHAALMHHLKYIHLPYYKGIVIRRTTPMLTKPGAIWDEARILYKEIDPSCKIRLKDMKINLGPVKEFESKAEISFTHFEHVDNTDNFQGSQLSSAVLDELCQFEESQFLLIQSRLRTKANMKPVIRGTMNPDPDSWVRAWIDWYLFPKGHEMFGRPDPSKQGKVRWFIRKDNLMMWGDSREELYDRYGVRGSDGNLLPEDHRNQIKPLSFSFIAASVYDNPYIEPSYIAFLEGLPRVEREILLYGNWEARPEASGFFKRQWVEPELLEAPGTKEFVRICRAYDLAASLKSETNPNPDYSVGVKMGLLKNGEYVILDVIRWRARAGDVERKILEIAAQDGKRVDVVIPRDPGASGLAAAKTLAKAITGAGFYVRMKPVSGSKIDRFRPFCSAAQNGIVHILKGCCNDLENKVYNDNGFYYSEMEIFDGGRKNHDDLCDATADAFMYLAESKKIPVNFKLPSFVEENPFAFN